MQMRDHLKDKSPTVLEESCSLYYNNKMTSLWDRFLGKNILITGGSGFLGTAIVYRLITKAAPPEKIYILCRGGRE